MDRREFIRRNLFAGLGLSLATLPGFSSNLFADNTLSTSDPDLVAVKGSNPAKMFDSGIAALGGMSRFVKKGQTVVVKPNIGWDSSPELAANTNPALIRRIVEHCYTAGARDVYVFDHTCDHWKNTYRNSGIEQAAKSGGAKVVPAHHEKYYQTVKVPGGRVLKKVGVHELVLDSDVLINVPILKDHRSARLTIAMKNLMGVVWDRWEYHSKGLNQCIVDFCRVLSMSLMPIA